MYVLGKRSSDIYIADNLKCTVTGATHKKDTSAQSYDIVNDENLGCKAAHSQHYLPSHNSI